MKYITNNDLEELQVGLFEFVEWVNNALLAKHESLLPPKISIKQEGHRFFNVMPCIVPQLNISALRSLRGIRIGSQA